MCVTCVLCLFMLPQALEQLDSLNIENNDIMDIPAHLAVMPNLRTLLIAGNPQRAVRALRALDCGSVHRMTACLPA